MCFKCMRKHYNEGRIANCVTITDLSDVLFKLFQTVGNGVHTLKHPNEPGTNVF